MNPGLRAAIEQCSGTAVQSTRPLSGGDINDAFEVALENGDKIFVKTHPDPPNGMFEAEAHGLRWLKETETVRVPEVLAVSDDRPAYLALELLTPAKRVHNFDEELGRALAALHAHGAPSFGLDRDNFIGRLPQSNTQSGDWAAFYWRERLEAQLRLATDRGSIDSGTRRQFQALQRVLPDRVGSAEPPSRLHGDLWGGNLHVDDGGRPCLIDPAVYGGHREIDLAMMRLFGGFGSHVFAAYEEAWPLAPGAEERIPLYQLYPLLVHVNLFGGSYVSSVKRALSECLR
jgi:fructosamine-3-kinase